MVKKIFSNFDFFWKVFPYLVYEVFKGETCVLVNVKLVFPKSSRQQLTDSMDNPRPKDVKSLNIPTHML